jgi:hypothetical protein
MRRFTLLFFFLLLISMLTSCADSSYMIRQDSPPPAAPGQGHALIYFMRPSAYAWGVHFPIYHGENLIGLSQAKSYFTHECLPGEHKFIGMAENKVGLKADLEADKTYFVLIQSMTGETKARMVFAPVSPGSQWWEEVEGYKTSLVYAEKDVDALQAWDEANRENSKELLTWIYDYMDTVEGQKYVVKIGPDAGR